MTLDEELALIQQKAAPAANPAAVQVAPAPEAAAPAATPSMADAAPDDVVIPDPTPFKADPEVTAEPNPGDDMPALRTDLPVMSNDEPVGIWDNMNAGWTEDTITRNRRGYHETKRRDLSTSMYRMLPEAAQQRITKKLRNYTDAWVPFENAVVEEVGRDIARDPVRYGDVPLTIADFDARITAEEKAELAEAQATLERPGGLISEFAGSAASTMFSPTQAALMFAGGGAGGLLRILATEAIIGGVSEAVDLPDQFDAARRLGLPEPDALSQIALGAGLSAGFVGAIHTAARLPSAARSLQERAATRRQIAIQSAPEGMAPHEAALAVDAAEGALRGQRTVQEAIAPTSEAGTLGDVLGLPTVQAPSNWDAIKNGIFAGESGGDYDALFGFSNRSGGKFANVRITEMTIDQAIEFSSPSNVYAQTVKGQIGRVATPMGAYQVVGTTLRAAKKALGLTGREKMDKRTQDLIGKWIYRTQGTQAWVGYKGPRSTPPPPPGSDVPSFRSSRGYTETGQVTAGDGFKIDVDYQVVDLSTLFRASGEFQPRDRSRVNSDAWIADTAARLDPAQLMPSPTADRGAPIVGPDGMIESGNGRYGAIERAYERHPDRAGAYRAQIEAAGYAIPEGVTRPILVARRKTDLSTEQLQRFTLEAQDSGVAAMTPTEVAKASSRAMSAPVLGQLDPSAPLTDAANGGFVRAALAGLPRSARNAMFDASGMLNREGNRQLREALFARAWPDADILARFTETDAGEMKSLMEALESSAPAWAALRADIEAGAVVPDMDISGHILDAMRLIAQARDLAKKGGPKTNNALAELLDEVDLLAGPVPPLTVAMVRKFWTNGRAAKADDVAGFLTRYANDARKAGAAGAMFDNPSPRDVLLAIDKPGFADVPADIGAARGYRAAEPTQPEALPEAGFDQGAASPEAVAADAAIRADMEPPRLAAPEKSVDIVGDQLNPSYSENMGLDAPRTASAAVASASDSSTALSSPSTSSAISRDPATGTQSPSSDQILARPASDTAANSDASNTNSLMGESPFIEDTTKLGTTAGDVKFADLRDGFEDLSIDMPDGTALTIREVLDDLEADGGFDAFIQACAISPIGAAL